MLDAVLQRALVEARARLAVRAALGLALGLGGISLLAVNKYLRKHRAQAAAGDDGVMTMAREDSGGLPVATMVPWAMLTQAAAVICKAAAAVLAQRVERGAAARAQDEHLPALEHWPHQVVDAHKGLGPFVDLVARRDRPKDVVEQRVVAADHADIL